MPAKQITILTTKDIRERCYAAAPAEYAADPMISLLKPGPTKKLRGREFTFCFPEGQKLYYRFERDYLEWKEKQEDPWNEEYGECLESSRDGVFLIHHLRTHINPYEAATLILDTNTGLVTMIYDRLGKKSANRDVNRQVLSGFCEGEACGKDSCEPHQMTDDLVGKVIDWKMADDIIIHTYYCNVECLAFISPIPPKAPGWADYFKTFNPTKYIKIGEKLYAISFYAPWQCGMEVTMLMDLDKMRALGAAFGFDSTDKFSSYTFGAKGAYAELGFIGQYTVN